MLQTRNAKRPAQAAVRFARRRRRRGAAHARGGAHDDRRRARSTRCCTRRSTPRPTSRCSRRGVQRLAGRGQGRGRLHRRRGGRGRRGGPRRRSSCARSPRPTTSPASTPPRGSSPPRAARPRTPRSSRAAWAGPRVVGAGELAIDLEARGDPRRRARRSHEGDLIAIDGTTGCVTLEDVPLVERRGPQRASFETRARAGPTRSAGSACAPTPTRRADARKARELRRRGHRPVPHRAHVHGRGPPAEDAGDDHGRRPRTRAARRSPSCCRCSRRTSRACSRR